MATEPPKPPHHPEVGRELFLPDLKKLSESKTPTVVVLGKDKHTHFATSWFMGIPSDGLALFYWGEIKTIIGLHLKPDGKLYDMTNNEQVHCYEWLDPDVKTQ